VSQRRATLSGVSLGPSPVGCAGQGAKAQGAKTHVSRERVGREQQSAVLLGIGASSGRQIALSPKEPLPPLLLRYLTKFEPKGSRHPVSQLLVRSSSTRPAGHIGTRR